MNPEDQYLAFVTWSQEDQAYVGFCPDLFPHGGVCHAPTAVDAYARLRDIMEDTLEASTLNNLPLPTPRTRPMQELDWAA